MRRSTRSLACSSFALAFLGAAGPARSLTFPVTNTADSGPGSLRQAILAANASPGSTIVFSIGSGLQTIRPLSELPLLVSGTIDGTTQPGYSFLFPRLPLIQIDGSLLPALSDGLKVGNGSASAVVRALLVNRCPRAGIRTNGSVVIEASWIGIDANGIVERPNRVGIHVESSGATIGGGFAKENVISGNSTFGILMNGAASVLGNTIGTGPDATAAVPNLIAGVSVEKVSNVAVGGEGFNMISGNGDSGILIFESSNVAVVNNFIGPSSFLGPVGAQRVGIRVVQSSDVRIGGSLPNTIDFNVDVGVAVDSTSQRVEVSTNSFLGNGFGIDLNFVPDPIGSRVTPNDPNDADVGANLLQNFPVLESAFSNFTSTTVRGSIHSNSSSALRLEFYSTESCNASGYGEGKGILGRIEVETNPDGYASFSAVLPISTPPGQVVTATATDSLGNTSEFSGCVAVTKPPGQFFTVTPCRIVDTRDPDGARGGPALAPLSARVFPVAGSCEIPPTAMSVSVNVTVTEPSAGGHLTLYPADVGAPLASTINFAAGQTRANNAVLALPANGSGLIGVLNGASGTVHFILDVNGYFE